MNDFTKYGITSRNRRAHTDMKFVFLILFYFKFITVLGVSTSLVFRRFLLENASNRIFAIDANVSNTCFNKYNPRKTRIVSGHFETNFTIGFDFFNSQCIISLVV